MSASGAELNIPLPAIPLPASFVENGLPTLSVDVTVVLKPFTDGSDPSSHPLWETRISLQDVIPALLKVGDMRISVKERRGRLTAPSPQPGQLPKS